MLAPPIKLLTHYAKGTPLLAIKSFIPAAYRTTISFLFHYALGYCSFSIDKN